MQTNKDMSDYRFSKAAECLSEAKTLIQAEKFSGAANRSYYCIFHCMRSVLALKNADYKKLSAVIAHFREKYIKTNIFDKRLSDIYSRASAFAANQLRYLACGRPMAAPTLAN